MVPVGVGAVLLAPSRGVNNLDHSGRFVEAMNPQSDTDLADFVRLHVGQPYTGSSPVVPPGWAILWES